MNNITGGGGSWNSSGVARRDDKWMQDKLESMMDGLWWACVILLHFSDGESCWKRFSVSTGHTHPGI